MDDCVFCKRVTNERDSGLCKCNVRGAIVIVVHCYKVHNQLSGVDAQGQIVVRNTEESSHTGHVE